MNSAMRVFLLLVAGMSIPLTGWAQTTTKPAAMPVSKVRYEPLPQPEIDRIIQTFSAKETQFRQALNQYGFTRDATVRTISRLGKQITGEFRLVSAFAFDDKGKRVETVLFAPAPTLTEIIITPEDLEDLGGIQPYALEADKISQYNFNYIGKEKIDELDLFVFDVTPKNLDENKVNQRFFKGRIWVDDHDLMIVKVRGKGVPEGKQRFPTFETYREQIDGKHWFPTYTYSDDELVFPGGQIVHEQMVVKYTKYREAIGTVRIIDDDNQIIDDSEPKPSTPPAKTPEPAKPAVPPKKP
ncbi:MAG: hypothetical protein ABIP75_19985 [Pyrinomonadaceae bacterium]